MLSPARRYKRRHVKITLAPTSTAIAMQFADSPKIPEIGFNTFVPFPDGKVGFFLEGTFELSILDATGIYKRFKGWAQPHGGSTASTGRGGDAARRILLLQHQQLSVPIAMVVAGRASQFRCRSQWAPFLQRLRAEPAGAPPSV